MFWVRHGQMRRGYKVVRRQINPPFVALANMDAYYLLSDDNKALSFWRDLPFEADSFTMTCCIEIPKESRRKLQVNKAAPHHPFTQDTVINKHTQDPELRCYAQFPLFNYGFIPQTWEQNLTPENGYYGDDDPIDVCQISTKKRQVGDVFQARILGGFCLIDQEQIDFKVIMLDEEEMKPANRLQQLRAIHRRTDKLPSELINDIMNWFVFYKTFDGKPQNVIAENYRLYTATQTLEVVMKTHKQFQDLLLNPQLKTKYNL